MYIESLELKNYRNYESLHITFDCGTNILLGDNAQGKTNILESMYVCGTTKSHRGSKDKDMIRFGEEESHIRLFLMKNGTRHKIDMHLKKNKSKGAAIDGIPIRKAAELFGMIHFVFFSPEDLNIIKNGPHERRKFMDSELCQINRFYLTQLTNYNKVVQQRNKLLKDLPFSGHLKDTLDIWDQQMVSHGRSLIEEREKFIFQINRVLKEIHKNITGGKEEIELIYEPNVRGEEFERKIALEREKDLRQKISSTGPHRDDFCVRVNGIDIRKFGSQGQQRSAALSLKLSEIYLVRSMIHDQPVLLLDDVLSELDSSRQKYLLKSIRDIQTFITCTGVEEFVQNQFPLNRIFEVVNGCVSVNQVNAEQED
ncbi:MAG TPA: DNA replication/repair protein RecF [Candidatus Scatomonas pullistercoris]|uniref:DNA replication and repair protein RecF n=1 Tax=Candidatus Scatomonas pullistercoris TaxID=2840920 RepID=A0A9D1P3N8_9FIRM|nr:DNA replication/repair protein RecF [Candidatus Scatomonas pullistercoris]